MLNRITLIGRLTRDPEVNYTTGGIAVTRFRLAVDRGQKDPQTGEKQADFIDIVTWRQTAEFVGSYITKGRLVSIDGRLQMRSWMAQDGTKRTAYEVVADRVDALDSKPSGEERGASGDRPSPIAHCESDSFAEDSRYDNTEQPVVTNAGRPESMMGSPSAASEASASTNRPRFAQSAQATERRAEGGHPLSSRPVAPTAPNNGAPAGTAVLDRPQANPYPDAFGEADEID